MSYRFMPVYAALALTAAGLAVLASASGAARAGGDPSSTCLNSIHRIAQTHQVPAELLRAIARVESGRVVSGRVESGGLLQPWPFAINAAGTSYFAGDIQEAIRIVGRKRQAGVDSIDVGCMQINLKWHPTAFSSLSEGFDSDRNVRFAAGFLLQLKERHGSWAEAVAHYHSGRPAHQRRYLCRVYRALAAERWAESIAGAEAMPNRARADCLGSGKGAGEALEVEIGLSRQAGPVRTGGEGPDLPTIRPATIVAVPHYRFGRGSDSARPAIGMADPTSTRAEKDHPAMTDSGRGASTPVIIYRQADR